jgi:hypothetical protein
MRTYSVDLLVLGQVTTSKTIKFETEKELNLGNIFRSEISIKPNQTGFKISCTVSTVDKDRAFKVALLFIGKMLDVLSLLTHTSLFVSNDDFKSQPEKNSLRAIVSEFEFRKCFKFSRDLNLDHPAFLRGLNWFRKGLYTADPYDKFLAYWNSISVVSAKYHISNARTRSGIINQIYTCFESLWGGNVLEWENVNSAQWINENNRIRDEIAHGVIPVEVIQVENVISKLDNLEIVAQKFLSEWLEFEIEGNRRLLGG